MTGAPRGTFRLLMAHFLSRFFRSEQVRYEAAARDRISGALAALAVASPILFFMVFTLYIFAGGEVGELWPFGAHFFGLVMIVLGLLATLVWDDLLPDEVDLTVLTVMPIPRTVLMWAKVCAVALLLGACALALSSLTPLVFASFLQLPSDGPLRFVRVAAAYFAGAFLAGVLAFTSCGALRGAELLLPGWRGLRRASTWIQSALTFAWVGALAHLPLVADRLPDLVERDPSALLAMPPAWFVGLAGWLSGENDPAFLFLAEVALFATALSSFLFGWTLTLGFRYPPRNRGDRGEEGHPGGASRWVSGIVNGLILRHPQERATFWFFVRTLWGSPGPRMRLLFHLASAAGCIFIFRASGIRNMTLAAPIATFLAVVGIRSAVGAPVQERAGWILHLTETEEKAPHRSGLRWGIVAAVLAPVFATLASVLLAFGAVPHLAAHLAFHFLLACFLAENLVVGLAHFPFATLPAPGNHAAPAWFLLGFYAYVDGLVTFEGLALTDRVSYLSACTAVGAILAAGMLFRRRIPPSPFVFRESADLLGASFLSEEEE